jgi:hypothetical protein
VQHTCQQVGDVCTFWTVQTAPPTSQTLYFRAGFDVSLRSLNGGDARVAAPYTVELRQYFFSFLSFQP